MKNLLFSLFTFCFFNSKAEGCEGPKIAVGNFYGLELISQSIGSFSFPKYSTYTISAFGNRTCYYKLLKVKIYLNDILILKLDTDNCYRKDFVLGAYPGSYRVEVILSRLSTPANWRFEIIDNPLGLEEKGEHSFFSVFPNPANSVLNVQSNKEINELNLYSISGALISHLKPDSQSILLPLEEYPPGIYFLHVAILGEQTVIKKIVIQ